MATRSNRRLKWQPINSARRSPSSDESRGRGTGRHSPNGQALHEGVLPGFETPGTFAERPRSGKKPGSAEPAPLPSKPKSQENRDMSIRNITLNSGHTIPQLGFGTYKITGEDTQRTVEHALSIGYRHIDTAQMYGNEAEVGAAIAASPVPREELFVTTKLDNGNHAPDRARESFAESLTKLGLDYVDLFLIHWPLPNLYGTGYLAAWKTMEEFVEDGRARSIGVSNFERDHLQLLIDESGTVPAVNQIELHPLFQNREVAQFCRDNGIAVEAWAPLVRGAIADNPVVANIASARGCTPAQAILAWHFAKGHIVFPKSVTPARIAENFASADVALTPADVEAIDSLDRGEAGRTGYHPETMERAAR